MHELDDNALLRNYVERESEEAFATLVTRHVNKVYSTALRHTRNPDQAEEITQAVFVILARKSATLSRHVVLSGWLYQTARLTALTAIRSEIRRIHREQEACMQMPSEESESEAWPQIRPLLDAALAGLNTADRHAIVLRYFDGKSMREVGAALGASEEAAKVRVSRAVEKLRVFFARRGVNHTTEILTGALSTHGAQAAPPALAKLATTMALAKGAAAGASTSTLIHGVLKLMAWSKAKTAAITAAIILAAVVSTLVVVRIMHTARVASYPNLQGVWEGVLDMGGPGVYQNETDKTRVVVRLFKTNGEYSAMADAIEAGRKGIPIGVSYHYPSLKFLLNPRMQIEATVNADGTQITLMNSIFRRTNNPDTVPEKLSEADFTPRDGSDLQGFWVGKIGRNGLPLAWKIAEGPAGTFRAEMDNPMQGADGQPVDVDYKRPTVKWKVATGNGMFEGDINSDNTEIVGNWFEGGQKTPMTVKRTDYATVHVPEAFRDYSYKSPNDLQGHWKGAWILPYGPVKVKIRFTLDIAKLPDGSFFATLANIDQLGNNDPTPASQFHYSGQNLQIAWNWMGAKFEGKMKNGKIDGIWRQGGGGFPLVFER